MTVRCSGSRWLPLALAAVLGLAVVSAIQVSTASVGHAFGRSGPMDAQPAQSPAANTTYPPGTLTGGGAPPTLAGQGWVFPAGAALVVIVLAGAVGAIWSHRRTPR